MQSLFALKNKKAHRSSVMALVHELAILQTTVNVMKRISCSDILNNGGTFIACCQV
jgi:hypothetical protein